MNLEERARRASLAARRAVETADLRRPMPGSSRGPGALGRWQLMGAAAVFLAVAVTAGALAVGGDGRMATTADGGRIGAPPTSAAPVDSSAFQLVSDLRPFDDCEELTTYAREEALAQVGPYGLEGTSNRLLARDGAVDDAGGEVFTRFAPQVEQGQYLADAPQVTGTNVQEVGVDEPDLVKTDGELLVALAKGQLQVVDLSGDEPELRSTVGLQGGYDHDVLLSGDRALVISGGGFVDSATFAGDTSLPSGGPATLQLVDLSDPSAPSTVASMTLDASTIVDSRLVGDAARVVVRSSPDLPFTMPNGSQLSQQLATETNRSVVRTATAEAFLPSYRLEAGGQVEEGQVVACEDVGRPEEPAGLESLSVLTFALSEGLEPLDTVGTMGAGDTMYASATSVYVAGLAPNEEGRLTTAVHKFDTTDPAATSYLGSGEVRGTLLNRYSLSEHEGVLRIATTEQDLGPSATMVSTLAERDGALVLLGQVGDIGRNEQVQAVRFVGDQGYVVTFRVTDPLFVIDLSEPTAPRLTGELQVPGYSAYLHPLGDGRLLGVGQDGTEGGRIIGSQVSLFDVSDPAAPARLDALTFPGGQSEVEYEPRSFQYLADRKLAVVPLLQYEAFGAEGFSGAVVVEVGDGTVEERSRLSHGSASDSTSLIRRVLAVDDVLYTLSDAGLAAIDLDSFEERSYLTF